MKKKFNNAGCPVLGIYHVIGENSVFASHERYSLEALVKELGSDIIKNINTWHVILDFNFISRNEIEAVFVTVPDENTIPVWYVDLKEEI